MTFPSKLLRLQIGGPLFETESWSMGFHFTTTGDIPDAESMQDLCEAFYTNMAQVGRHDSAKLGFIKFNELDHITGKYANEAESNAFYYSAPFSSSGTPALLPQGALCITLTTAHARGRGHAGRVYLPGYGAVSANGHLGSSQCALAATHVATFLNAVTLFGGDMTAVVWSKIGDSVTPITGAKTGDIVDTQRRRRSSLPEGYWATATAVE